MSYRMKLAGAVALALMLAGCASTSFQSTWKNPEAAPVLKEKGATVVAVVMAEDKYIRQGAEDALAKELTKRGYKGVASYLILTPEATMDENLAKAIQNQFPEVYTVGDCVKPGRIWDATHEGRVFGK